MSELLHRSWDATSYVLREVAVVKHKAFSQEQEWRLFWSGDLRWPPKIRTRASGLVPYLDIAVNAVKLTALINPSGAEGDELSPTVAEVVVGPGPSQPEQVVATRDLVKISWNDPNVVRSSNVPFRG